jgi:hypothetical protein
LTFFFKKTHTDLFGNGLTKLQQKPTGRLTTSLKVIALIIIIIIKDVSRVGKFSTPTRIPQSFINTVELTKIKFSWSVPSTGG